MAPPIKRIEQEFYIPNGSAVSYPLITSSGDRDVLSDEGSGLPPIEYITERGPFQHGESVTDYFLKPRTVQYLVRQNFCSRQAMLDGRSALLNAIRPNRQGGPIGVIRKIRPDGSKRDLSVVPVEGPRFEPRQLNTWDEWSFQEVLRFVAYDPVYFDPVQYSAEIAFCANTGVGFPYTFPFYFAVPCELTFPISFPISFYEWNYAIDIDYGGTWQEYPTIEIAGPAGPYIRITNETTGQSIEMTDLMIPDGDTVTIALTYGSQLITNVAGTNLLSHVTAEGNLSEFHLQQGINTIRAILRGGGDASIFLRYYHRFIGI